MSDEFVGRTRELAALKKSLRRAQEGGRAGRPGRAILMRGRRRVGKSRLAEEFVERAGTPYLFFTASAQSSLALDLQLFVTAATDSNLPGASGFRDQAPHTWDAALHLLAGALPTDQPSIVVFDEMPYLIANDPGFEGTLQKVFDRTLSRLPVLLLCIGSDLAMMEALNDYGRPFHQRATEMVISPLTPADVATMAELSAAEAFDAFLVSGGLPLILDEWQPGAKVLDYVTEAVTDPTSALLISGERAVAAEFPTEAQARQVLTAIGSGERTFALIARSAGDMPATSLRRALQLLITKRIVKALKPLSTQASKETRYVIVDPYLKFWLKFIAPYMEEIERGRGDLTANRIRTSWTTWRGKTIEQIILESLRRLPDQLPENTKTIGGYWTRTNTPEIDIVGADREPIAQKITVVGSIKWLENRPFDAHDLGALAAQRAQLPGAEDSTQLLAVSRSGSTVSGVQILRPEDLLAAW